MSENLSKKTQNENKKTNTFARRTLNRSLWGILNFLPTSIRKYLVRSQFAVDYDLPKELTFKQAETADEIQQALSLVHEAYVELGYMHPTSHNMRFLKHHALPTTAILIAKWNDEVIGTMSILADSALGLPVDTTWDISKYRKHGQILAEISSLTIKPSFKNRRGKLLFPLCKLMWRYCRDILKVDGIVIAVDEKVEPFYTDILLFERTTITSGQHHSLVNGKEASCCFLRVGAQTEALYKKTYGQKKADKNLHYFFTVHNTSNVILPAKKESIEAYLISKHLGIAELMNQHSDLSSTASEQEKAIIANLDSVGVLPKSFQNVEYLNSRQRLNVRKSAWAFSLSHKTSWPGQIIDLSTNGFQFKIEGHHNVQPGEEIVVNVEIEGMNLILRSEIIWTNEQNRLGCKVVDNLPEAWLEFVNSIWSEIAEQKRIALNNQLDKSQSSDSENAAKNPIPLKKVG